MTVRGYVTTGAGISLAVGLCAVLYGIYSHGSAAEREVLERLDRIHEDMEEQEVDKILGEFTCYRREQVTECDWKGRPLPRLSTFTKQYSKDARVTGLFIEVQFDSEGRVVGKMWSEYCGR